MATQPADAQDPEYPLALFVQVFDPAHQLRHFDRLDFQIAVPDYAYAVIFPTHCATWLQSVR